MMSAQFHVDVVSELEKILPSCKLLVPTAVDVYKRQASACIIDAGEAEDLINDVVEKVEELKK